MDIDGYCIRNSPKCKCIMPSTQLAFLSCDKIHVPTAHCIAHSAVLWFANVLPTVKYSLNLYKCVRFISEIMNQFCHVGVKFLVFNNIS